MRERAHRGRWRLVGALAVGVYLAGGLGPAGGALAAYLRSVEAPVPGVCGCTEGAACCGAACCAPAGAADDPAGALALVARCTCGHRDHQSTGVHLPDAHLPAAARVGACPPPAARLARERDARAAVWSPEPRDGVPKSPCLHA